MSKFKQFQPSWLGSSFVALLVAASPAHTAVVDLAPGDLYPAANSYSVVTLTHTQSQYAGLYTAGRSDQTRKFDIAETNINFTVFRAREDGKSFFLSAGLPYVRLVNEINSMQTSGMGDLQIGTGVWLLNDIKTNQAAGIGVSSTLPTGSYASTQPLNIGENRYRYNLLARYRTKSVGPYWLDLMLQKNWLSDNTNFRGVTLRTHPSESVTAYLAKRLDNHSLIFIGYEKTWGGESYINDQRSDHGQNEERVQLGWRGPVSRNSELVIRASQSSCVTNGYKQSHRLSLSINRRL